MIWILVQIHVMSTNSSQIEWRDLASFTSPHSQKKQYTPNSKKSFKFYEAKDVQQKIYRKRMKNPGIWCHVSWNLPYPSLKTFKKKKRVSNNNSCDSLRIHDNSTTNSCEEALKTILPWKLGNSSDLANTMISYNVGKNIMISYKCFIIYIYFGRDLVTYHNILNTITMHKNCAHGWQLLTPNLKVGPKEMYVVCVWRNNNLQLKS